MSGDCWRFGACGVHVSLNILSWFQTNELGRRSYRWEKEPLVRVCGYYRRPFKGNAELCLNVGEVKSRSDQ